VLAIDVAGQTVRGLVLDSGTPAVAGGYAQLDFEPAVGPATFAARIAAALDVKATMPVVITCDPLLGDAVAARVAAAITDSGFVAVTVVSRNEAEVRANPGGGEPDDLAGVDIPLGLLASHVGLTLAHLAAVVGAGSGVLSGDIDTDAGWLNERTWSPISDALIAADTDLSTESSSPVASASGGVPGVGADATMNPEEMSASALAAAVAAARAATTRASTGDTGDTGVGASAVALGPGALGSGVTGSGVTAGTAQGDQASGRGWVLMIVVAATVVAALGGLVVTQCGGSDSNSAASDTTTGETEVAPVDGHTPNAANVETNNEPALTGDAAASAEPQQVEVTPEPETAADPTVVPTATTEAEAEAEPTTEPEPTADPLAGLPPLSALPERGAIFRPPTLFLGGPVQTQEQADELYARASAVVGPDNVVNNYVVRPDAPEALDGNVRVEQAVLFQSASAAISDEFVPTLELGVAVMALNPQVQMVVEGHTDSVGTEANNLVLSRLRAEAVVDYLVSRGVDAGRLEAVGFGETSPVADNDTAGGRQINRRIEVELLDLLAGD